MLSSETVSELSTCFLAFMAYTTLFLISNKIFNYLDYSKDMDTSFRMNAAIRFVFLKLFLIITSLRSIFGGFLKPL
jgi:hypothetical protein